MRSRSFEEYLQTVGLQSFGQGDQRVHQRFSAGYHRTGSAGCRRPSDNLFDGGYGVAADIPGVFGIAPRTPYVASGQADEIGGRSRLISLSLDGVEILCQRQCRSPLFR